MNSAWGDAQHHPNSGRDLGRAMALRLHPDKVRVLTLPPEVESKVAQAVPLLIEALQRVAHT